MGVGEGLWILDILQWGSCKKKKWLKIDIHDEWLLRVASGLINLKDNFRCHTECHR